MDYELYLIYNYKKKAKNKPWNICTCIYTLYVWGFALFIFVCVCTHKPVFG